MMARGLILAIMCGTFLCFSAAQEQEAQPREPPVEAQKTESPSAASEDYKIDASEIKKKPYHLGGFAEFRPVVDGLRDNSSLYKVNFYNKDEGATTQGYNSRVQLDGTLEKGIARLFARGNISVNNSYQGWSNDSKLYEGYLTLRPSESWIFDTGKKTFRWGKGYAWNPVAFIDQPKDPTDPDLALEGFWTASAQYLRSFHGAFKTFSFTAVLLPVFYNVYGQTGINDGFAGTRLSISSTAPQTSNQVNAAVRAYFLFHDTDIDFTFFTGQTKTTRYGIDFSRNIRTNLEVHGELASITNFQKNFVQANGVLQSSTNDDVSYLLGVRFLSSKLTTYILEYYRNGTGYTTEQMQGMFSYIDNAYKTYVSTGNAAPIQKASTLVSGNVGRNSPMQDYVYLRISQEQPFGILYYTPAVSSIVNLDDRSFQLVPELVCTRITNWEIRVRTYVPVGGKHTEFGEKQNDYRVELRVRRFF